MPSAPAGVVTTGTPLASASSTFTFMPLPRGSGKSKSERRRKSPRAESTSPASSTLGADESPSRPVPRPARTSFDSGERERRQRHLGVRSTAAQLLGHERRARDEVTDAPQRPALDADGVEHVAELPPPRRSERPVEAGKVVDVQRRRLRQRLGAPDRLDLVEVDDVDLLGRLGHARGEGAGELASRAANAAEPPSPLRERRHRDELDRQLGGGVTWDGEMLEARDRAHVDAVACEPPQQPERDLARRAALRQGRLGEDDEDAQRADVRDRDGFGG